MATSSPQSNGHDDGHGAGHNGVDCDDADDCSDGDTEMMTDTVDRSWLERTDDEPAATVVAMR